MKGKGGYPGKYKQASGDSRGRTSFLEGPSLLQEEHLDLPGEVSGNQVGGIVYPALDYPDGILETT